MKPQEFVHCETEKESLADLSREEISTATRVQKGLLILKLRLS